MYRTEVGPRGMFPGNWLDGDATLAPAQGRLGRYVAMYAVTLRKPREVTVGGDTQPVGLTARSHVFGPVPAGDSAVVSSPPPLMRAGIDDPRRVSVYLGPALSSDQPRFLLPERGYFQRETGLIGAETTTFQWMTSRTRMGIHVLDRPGQAWTLQVTLRSPIRRKAMIRFSGGATGPVTGLTLPPGRDTRVVVRGVRLAGERGNVVINFAGPRSDPNDPRPLFAQLRSATITP
jgi:hypothetical protein